MLGPLTPYFYEETKNLFSSKIAWPQDKYVVRVKKILFR